MPAVEDDYDTLYINYAAVAWHEMRRAWRGDQSFASQIMPIEPTMSWNTSYQDLLSSKEHFDGPVPLAKMVEFLVKVWKKSS
ncbi:hypothetical protein CDL12_28279 [Handroanthus impetiginosus]|uniref:Gag1-like clamp domain-containing protein n=1 Tax=Handroanthus impetiginosus TaxID=429701 RepID=A0A2G9G1P9_9LAMI|nr:hypothetical protein CDL12_28279 [Handroanthus impetiginosus]